MSILPKASMNSKSMHLIILYNLSRVVFRVDLMSKRIVTLSITGTDLFNYYFVYNINGNYLTV